MSFFFGDGFDLYTQITDCGGYWDSTFGGTATLAISAAGRFAGSRGLVCINGSGVTPYLTKTSSVNDAVHHISVAIQQTTTLTGASAYFYVTFFDGATAQCSIVFRSDGAILLTSGTTIGTTLATYTGAIAAINTWYQFEIEVVINNTTGSISVRKNGNTSNDFSLGSLNTRNSVNNYANKIGIGCGNVSGSQVMDDFLWRSDASSVTWAGDTRCFTRMPLADSAVQFTRSGSVVPLTPFVQGATAHLTANVARYSPFVATCDGTVGTASISMALALTGNMKCTIFNNGGSNTPGTVLASATAINNLVSGNNTFTFSSPPTVTRGTTYWISFNSDTALVLSLNVTANVTGYNLSSITNTLLYASFPVANPASLSFNNSANIFTVNITPTTLANADFVSEVVQDAAASYVYSSTNGQADLYTLGAISATPTNIIGVTTRGLFQKSDAGTRNATVQLKSGATTVQGTSTALPAGSWQWVARNDLVDPATSAAWTATGVNNALVGPVVTA